MNLQRPQGTGFTAAAAAARSGVCGICISGWYSGGGVNFTFYDVLSLMKTSHMCAEQEHAQSCHDGSVVHCYPSGSAWARHLL